MEYTWWRIAELGDFESKDLISQNLSLVLAGLGLRDIILCQTQETLGIVFEDAFLSVGLFDENPVEMYGKIAFISEDGGIFVGVAIED